jgi:phage host-nuclease inhibitor protein Gam
MAPASVKVQEKLATGSTGPVKGIPISEFKEEQFTLPFAIESRAAFEKACQEIAARKVKLAGIEARQAQRISTVRARYATPVERLTKEISERLDAAYAWALKNEASVFGDEKSLALPLADVSFRDCPPSVEALEGWKLSGIIPALRKWCGLRYVRISFELKKRAILADREKVKAFVWERRGIRIVQNKSLTIAPAGNPEAKVSLVR